MPESDLYEILHLHPSAHPDVIQAAYRRLALLYHPDKNPSPGASELMAQLNHAYEILSDPEKRAAYDRSREAQGGPTATSPSSTSSTQGSSSPRSAPRDSEGYFTLGSTKEEVWDIQGPPDQVEAHEDEERWNYGRSGWVKFDIATGRVDGWINPRGILRIVLEPGPRVTSDDFFMEGDHRDHVLRLHGTPLGVSRGRRTNEELWNFYGGIVQFSLSTGRVTGWTDGGGLKVQSDSTGPSTSYSGRTPPSGGTRASTGSNWRTLNNEYNNASIYTIDPTDSDYWLIVRFKNNELELFVVWETRVSFSELTTVNWQVDSGPTWGQSWNVGTTGDSTFMLSSEVRETIWALMSADEITVRVYPFGGNPITASFHVSGFRGPFLTHGAAPGARCPIARLKVCPASFSPSRLWLPSP